MSINWTALIIAAKGGRAKHHVLVLFIMTTLKFTAMIAKLIVSETVRVLDQRKCGPVFRFFTRHPVYFRVP